MKQKIKIIIYIIPILFFGLTLQKKKIELPKRTVISGKIRHLEVYPNTKELFVEITDFRDRKSVFKDLVNKDGSFKIEFPLYASQDIKLSLIDKIILHPGDSIYLNIDFKEINNVNFSGNSAELNHLLHKYLWSNSGAVNYYISEKIDFDKYKLYCDKVRTEAIEKLKKFINDENPPKEFEQWGIDMININYYYYILLYPTNYYNRNELGYKNWFDTTHYFNTLNSMDKDFNTFGATVVNSDIYKLLDRYGYFLSYKLYKDLPKGTGVAANKIFEIIYKNTTDNNVFRQMVLGNQYYNFLCANQILPISNEIKEPFIRLPLYDFYNTLKFNIENPKIASNAILSKMGTNGKDYLDSIIIQNKGKVLFVDLWATWCGPCLESMTRSKEIIPRYEGRNIEFIFICVNSTKEVWKATLSRMGIGGKQYFCDQEQSKDIRRGLGVEQIPHYILIDKQGSIVKSKCLDLERSQDDIDRLLNEY